MTDTPSRPPVFVSTDEYDRLYSLAYAAQDREPGADTLIEELARARVTPAADTPQDVVRMHDHVTFSYDGTLYKGFQLVYPHEADISARRISVLTHVGAMLLGLGAGETIAWQGGDSRRHTLDVEAVA
ncbi:MAG: GreA/GreB family elongation factor [Caulobacterales bacterium]|nr:GreA/GreB family elongation factor [Caulobacterales bacterium]